MYVVLKQLQVRKAIEVAQKAERDIIMQLTICLKAQKDQTLEKVEALSHTASSLQKQIEQLNQKLASFQACELLSQVKDIAGRQDFNHHCSKCGCKITS